MENKSPYRYIGFVILVLIIAKFIFNDEAVDWAISALRPLVFTFVIIYLINPMVEYFDKKTKLKRTGSVVISFFICFLMIAVFIGMIVPSIVDSVQVIIDNVPSNNDQFIELVNKIPFIDSFIETSSLQSFLDSLGQWFVEYSESLLGYTDRIISTVRDMVAAISLAILALLMSFYALKDNDKIGQSLEDAVNTFIPNKFTTGFLKVFKLVDESFRKFLIGKLYTCFILGAIVTIMIVIFNLIGPWGIKIPYAPLIGFIIGITNIIPYIGPLIGTIPCLFLAMFSGFWEVVVLLGIILVSQQIDNILVTPRIIGESVGLGPFWVILSISVGGALFGAIGMVLMVPITSVLLKLAMERIEAYKTSGQTG